MKLTRTISVFICAMIVIAAGALEVNASFRAQQSELAQKSYLYQLTITPPLGTTHSQRTLLAVSLAASELGILDPDEFRAAYESALALDDYQPLSDTSWNWIIDEDEWEYWNKNTFTYNGSGALVEIVSQGWDGTEWDNQSRILIEYDGSGRQISSTLQFAEGTGWENASRTLSEYDGNSNVSTSTIQVWQTIDLEWNDQGRTEITYSSGRIETSTSYFWDTDHWRLTGVSTFTYNGQGLPETLLTQFDSGSGLVNSTLTTYSYDPNGNQTLALTETWGGSVWLNSSRTLNSYDGSNREILQEDDSWLFNAWTPFTKDTTKYSGEYVSEEVHVDFFISNPPSRTLHTYDEGNMTLETIEQNWNPVLQAAPTAEWVNDRKDITVYDELATAVMIDREPWSPHYELGQNYPNPFNPTTVIQFSLHRTTEVEIAIYNLLGQQVITLEDGVHAPGVYETTWSGTDESGNAVPSGIYFYRLKAEDQIETRKMILLK